jgi:N4-gp56 family major capsid protein
MATLNTMTASDFDEGIPEFWAPAVIMDANQRAFWSRFEGPEGSTSAIIRKDDPLKKAGDIVNFTTVGQLYGDGVTGASTLAGNEEKFPLDGFQLTVDWLRNAVAFNARAEGRALFKPAKVAGQVLSNWWARSTDNDLFSQLIDTDTPSPLLYANNATALTGLDDNSTFGVNEVERIVLALEANGVTPLEVTRDNGEIFPVYGIVISEFDAYHLRGDSLWQNANAEAAVRSEKNRLFTGALGMIRGAMIFVHRGVRGRQGTPLRPETVVRGSHTDSVTTLNVGTTDTTKNWTKHFPSTGTIAVVNSAGATEFMDYSAKTANTFTVTRGDTYGASSTASAYVGGEYVVEGRYLSHQIGFGANIACRSFAKAVHQIQQKEDYDFEMGIGLAGVFGQKARLDSDDDVVNHVLMYSNSKPPEAA